MAQIINVEELLPNFGAAQQPLDDNLEYDLGNLTAFDPSPIEIEKGADFESSLLSLSRDNTQLLLNRIFTLPTEALPHEQGRLAILPPGSTVLPREKPVPKAKEPTKWEAFAKLKGIQKKKRGRMVFDEVTQQWAPRYGYKSAKSLAQDAEWAVEARGDEHTGAPDPWSVAAAEKKARVAKNQKQAERNVLRSATKGSKNRVDGAIDLRSAVELSQAQLGLNKKGGKGKKAATEKKGKEPHHVDVALSVAQRSTASMGRFDTLRNHEPVPRAPKSATNRAARHEAASRAQKGSHAEKGAALDVLGKVLKGQKDDDHYGETQRVNMDRIASIGQQDNERKNIDKKRKAASSGKKGKGGGKKQKR